MAKTDDTAAAAPAGVKLLFSRDYWPASPVDGEDRIRAGEVAELPTDEAFNVVELGVATRVKADA